MGASDSDLYAVSESFLCVQGLFFFALAGNAFPYSARTAPCRVALPFPDFSLMYISHWGFNQWYMFHLSTPCFPSRLALGGNAVWQRFTPGRSVARVLAFHYPFACPGQVVSLDLLIYFSALVVSSGLFSDPVGSWVSSGRHLACRFLPSFGLLCRHALRPSASTWRRVFR